MKTLTKELVRQMEMNQDGRDQLAAIRENNKRHSSTGHTIGFIFLTLVSLIVVPTIILPISLPLLGILAFITRPSRRR